MDGFESKARGRCPMSATVKYHICDIALRAGGARGWYGRVG